MLWCKHRENQPVGVFPPWDFWASASDQQGQGRVPLPPETFHRSPILYSLLVVSFTTGKIEIDIVFNIS